MGMLANSEDPDKMLQNVAFRQCLHCLLRQNHSSEKKIQYVLAIITCDHSIHTTDHPDLFVSASIEESIGLIRIKGSWSIVPKQ